MAEVNKYGTGRRLLSSLWVLLSFVFLGWIGIIIAGATSNTKKWTLEGIIYCLVLNIIAIITIALDLIEAFLTLAFAYWLITVIRSFVILPNYHLRREQKINEIGQGKNYIQQPPYANLPNGRMSPAAIAMMQYQTRTGAPPVPPQNGYNGQPVPPPNQYNPSVTYPPQPSSAQQYSPSYPQSVPYPAAQTPIPQQNDKLTSADDHQLIDINLCSEEEMAKLPGISIIMAKKASEYRTHSGGFKSVDEFFDFLALKPHFIVQVQPLVRCTPPSGNNPAGKDRTGRILDF